MSWILLFFWPLSVLADPGRDLCKIHNGGLKCSKMTSYFFPYDSFLSFNDDLEHFTSEMKYLKIEHSNISLLQSRSFQRTPHLTQVILSGICITEIEHGAFEGLRRLKLVDLSHNLFHRVPIDTFKYTGLGRLNLEGNTELEIPERGPILEAKFLTSLSLKNCSIRELSPSVFEGMPALMQLDLSYNHLQSLPGELFSRINKLMFVDLSNNKFASLDVKVFASIRAFPEFPHAVILSNNPWECDCQLAELWDWVTRNWKSEDWSDEPKTSRLRKLVECKAPKKLSWNAKELREIMKSCAHSLY